LKEIIAAISGLETFSVFLDRTEIDLAENPKRLLKDLGFSEDTNTLLVKAQSISTDLGKPGNATANMEDDEEEEELSPIPDSETTVRISELKITGFYPREGEEGTEVEVIVQSVSRLQNSFLSSFKLFFGAESPDCVPEFVEGDRHKVRLTTFAPKLWNCGYDIETEIPVVLQVRVNGWKVSNFSVGSFTFTSFSLDTRLPEHLGSPIDILFKFSSGRVSFWPTSANLQDTANIYRTPYP
jgi:hypothetical protein